MLGINSPKITYGFATGRVRALEPRMVSRARIDRLIEAQNIEEIHRVLAETDYGPELRAADTIDEVEAALEGRLGEVYQLLRESNLPADMARYFQSRHDFTNLRVLIKGGFGQQAGVELSRLGEVSGETAGAIVADRTFSGLPSYLADAAVEAVALYSETKRLAVIDMALDRRYFNNLLALALKLRSKWIVAYTRLLIDLANGRTVARSRQEAAKIESVADYLLDGGNIAGTAWFDIYSKPETIVDRVGAIPDGRIRQEVIDWLTGAAPVSEYDLMADGIMIDYLLSSHRFMAGPEPVFAYAAAREHEVKLLRMIVFAHLSGLPAARIKARIGRIYE